MAGSRDPSPGAEAQIVAKGEARRITDCFGTLEPARADAIRGAYLSGLSDEDLSARYGRAVEHHEILAAPGSPETEGVP